MKIKILLFVSVIGCMLLFFSLPGAAFQGPENERKYLKTYFTTDEPISSLFTLVASPSYIYICDRKSCEIHIFSKNGQKVKTIGRRGAGPQEWTLMDAVIHSNKLLYVASPSKLSIFKENGEFIKEIRPGARQGVYRAYWPSGENYIVYSSIGPPDPKAPRNYIYELIGPKLEKKYDFFQVPHKQYYGIRPENIPIGVFKDCQKATVSKDRLYIGNTEWGFYIAVFDLSGKKLYEIKKDLPRVKVTSNIKDTIINNFKKSLDDDEFKDFMIKRGFEFSDYIPAYLNFFVENDRIYIFRYPDFSNNYMTDILLLDLKGNILKKITKPLSIYSFIQDDRTVSFNEGKLYLPIVRQDDSISIASIDFAWIFKDTK